jgi:singapore isolate B (sub-type 7) whole genome shotgun sequence assembly, scaffold_12
MQDIVILAESKGISRSCLFSFILGSLIMEGFNEKAVRECIKLPKRYQVAGIISLGYEPENGQVKPSARFPFGDDCWSH